MNEFSFYHIVNEHSRKTKAESPKDKTIEIEPEVVKSIPVLSIQTKKNVAKKTFAKKVVRNICYCLASIASAVLGIAAMALYILIV